MKIDLLDPAAYDHGQPYVQLRWLQEHDPVHWHPEPDGPGFWAVTRYGLVKQIESDWKTFSSEPVTTIPDENDVGDDEHHHLIFSDPPHHTIHRKFLAPELSPVPVRKMRERLNVVTNNIVDEVIERGECQPGPGPAAARPGRHGRPARPAATGGRRALRGVRTAQQRQEPEGGGRPRRDDRDVLPCPSGLRRPARAAAPGYADPDRKRGDRRLPGR